VNDHKSTYLTKLKKKKHLAINTYLHQRLPLKFENKLESASQNVHFEKQKPNNPIAPPILKKMQFAKIGCNITWRTVLPYNTSRAKNK
jgi:hypothetical protein